jgi:hypothetical protein
MKWPAPEHHPFVRVTRPANVTRSQSVPVKSASIRVASAVPTLPKVPRHPRGELNSPWVLIWVGGPLPGESAVDPVVSIVSHGCVDRIVARRDCMFVWGTTSNVHVMSPLVGGGGPNRIPSGCDKTGQNSRFPINIPQSQFCPVSPDVS